MESAYFLYLILTIDWFLCERRFVNLTQYFGICFASDAMNHFFIYLCSLLYCYDIKQTERKRF